MRSKSAHWWRDSVHLTGSSWLSASFSSSSANAALAVKHKITPTTLATTAGTEGCANPQSLFRQAIASQTRTPAREERAKEKPPRTSPCGARGGQIPRSKGPRLRRPQVAVAARRSAAEATASARERYTMPPTTPFPADYPGKDSRFIGRAGLELVHAKDGNRPLVNVTAAEPTRMGRPFTATER